MAKPAKVSPGEYSPEGSRLRVGYAISYGDGKESLLDIFLPLPDETTVELASHVDAVQLPEFLKLIEALKQWQADDGRIRP